jgi:hypothetical protein
MNEAFDFLIRHTMQCWACPVFDAMFDTVSGAAAAAYPRISQFALIIMAAFIAFYVVYLMVIKLKDSDKDPLFYKRLVKPVLLPALIISALLSIGIEFPKMLTSATIEPIAMMTSTLSKIPQNNSPAPGTNNKSLPGLTGQSRQNSPAPGTGGGMSGSAGQGGGNGFYSSDLKHSILSTMRTTTIGFQNLILFGLGMVNASLDWKILQSILLLDFAAILETILLFLLGIYIAGRFALIFLKFLFMFLDAVLSLTFFAFLFPIMLAAFVIRDSESPEWVKGIGGMSATFFKDVVSSIITLGSMMILYIVIISVISGFIGLGDQTTASALAGDFSNINFKSPDILKSASGFVILIVVIGFIINNIGKVAAEIKSAFGITEKEDIGNAAYKNAAQLTTKVYAEVKKLIKK